MTQKIHRERQDSTRQRVTKLRHRRRKALLRARVGVRFEPLESRQLLAADLGVEPAIPLVAGQPFEAYPPIVAADAAAEGEHTAESQDLVAFARALAESGTRFFGAGWCPHCKDQKELFEDGADFLPFIEVTNFDTPVTLNAVGRGEDLTLNPTGRPVNSFPTWEFPDGTRLEGAQALATLSQRSGVTIPLSDLPFIAPVDDGDNNPNDVDDDGDDIVNLLGGSPLHIPLDGYDPGGGPLTYTVTSDNSLVSTVLLQGNRNMLIDVAGWGKMNIQLFEERAPRPTSRLVELAQADFYDGVTFHRIEDGFVIQGGDPTGTGSGGSNLGDFDDQFHEELQHNRSGTVSYAKSADDTSDSQFFITEGTGDELRNLDGNHSVVGVVVEGEKNRAAISSNSTTNPRGVVMSSVDIFTDTENAVVMLSAAEGASGTANITVTATDADGHTFTREFRVDVTPDTFNTRPWMDDFGPFSVLEGATLQAQIPAQDPEGNPIIFDVLVPTNFNIVVPASPITPQSPAIADITITANAGFIGSEQVTFLAYDATLDLTGLEVNSQFLAENSSFFDVQTVTIESLGLDLLPSSDSGASDNDNITNQSNLTFAVSGVTPGATVTLRDGDTVVGVEDATSSNVQFTANLLPAGGEGVHDITVTQTIGGVEGNRTPPLKVTYDTTGPTFVSTPPLTAAASLPLTYDAQTDDEAGAGASYLRVDPVTGDPLTSGPGEPVVDPATGTFMWSPGAPDIGTATQAIRATDLAGNSTTQTFDLEVIHPPTIRVRLEVTKGGAIVSVSNPLLATETFQLNAYAQDVRMLDDPSTGGVVDAYLDVLYDSGLAVLAGAIVNGPDFQPNEANSGTTSTPGLIDHAGHSAGANTPTGQAEQLLWSVPLTAVATGTLTFTAAGTTDPADPGDAGQSPLFDSGVFGQDASVCPSASPTCFGTLEFVSTTVSIDASFAIQDVTFEPDEDSTDNPLLVSDVTSNPLSLNLEFVGTPSADHGSVVFANGSTTELRYTPAADYFGPDEIRFEVTDGADTLAGTQAIQVISQNDPPNAMDDTTEVDEDAVMPVSIDVRANDEAAPDAAAEKDNFRVTVVQTTSDQGGTVAIGTDGLDLTYLPPPNFNGVDTFTYTISDNDPSDPRTDTATVSVTVRDINDPPTAVNDTFGDDPAVTGDEANPILEGSLDVALDVLANDSSAPDDGEVISLVPAQLTQPANGTVSISTDGRMILFTPDPDFFGTDTFTYAITDDDPLEPRTATATVTVHVTGTNDPPTANNDGSLRVTQNTSDNILDVLANDTISPDVGEMLTITSVGGVTAGASVTITPDGQSILYSPAPGFLTSNDGLDTFSYTINDGNGGEDTATASVEVVAFVPGSLSGFVYIDTNNNGLREPGERGLAGVTVTLTGTSVIGTVNQSVQTAADGSYTFSGLAPTATGSSYVVTESQPSEDFDGDGIPLIDGKDTIGSQGGTVANDTFTIQLAEGVAGVANDFGELKGGTINVVVAPEDTRGLTVRLLAAGQEVRAGQTTDSLGHTSFVGVAPGDYQVEVAGPFLVHAMQDVTVGDQTAEVVVTLNVGELGLDPVYPSYLDSLSSRSTEYAEAAAGPAGLRWLATGPGWTMTTDVQIAMSDDGSTILTITDDNGTWQGSFPPSHPLINVLNSLADGTRRLRLNGAVEEFRTFMSRVELNTATVSIAKATDGNENGPVAGAFTVTRTSAGSTNATVSYSVSGTATAGTDFTPLSGSVAIPATTTSATITVPVLDDQAAEGTETVTVTLDAITSGAPGASIDTANNSASIDILDNDGAGEGEGELTARALSLGFVQRADRTERIPVDSRRETTGDSPADPAQPVDLAFASEEPFVGSGDEQVEFVTLVRDEPDGLIAAIDAALQDDLLAVNVV